MSANISSSNITLPSSWYRSVPVYQIERRAVFLKAWYLLGPITRFTSTDEPVHYELAQVQLLVRYDPITNDITVTTASGVPLRHHITPTGLLFSTISSQAPSFYTYFPDLELILGKVDFTALPYRRSISYPGNFNWKTMVDGYQECLHCAYTHPTFSTLYPTTFYTVHNYTNFSQHIADPKKPNDGLFLYFFPNCTLNVYGGGMSSFRILPTENPGVTRMEFDYYHKESGPAFEEYFSFVRQVAREDYELCERAQANLELGIYDDGILESQKEGGVIYYQQRVLELVCEQHEADKAAARASASVDRNEKPEPSLSADTTRFVEPTAS